MVVCTQTSVVIPVRMMLAIPAWRRMRSRSVAQNEPLRGLSMMGSPARGWSPWMMRAGFSGRRSPFQGQGYGSAGMNVMTILLSPRRRELGGLSGQGPGGRAGGDHDRERQHVGRGVEEVVTRGHPHRLQG